MPDDQTPRTRRTAVRPEAYFTPQELAAHWKVSLRTVQRMAEAGRLRPIRIGNRLRFSRAAVQRLEERLEDETAVLLRQRPRP